MNKETRNLQETMCRHIEPHDEFVDKPYKCSLDYWCIDTKMFAGVNYCGRWLRMQKDEEIEELKFEVREYERR